MKIVVLDRKVYQNLTLFRHLIHRQAEKKKDFFRKAKKTYRAFVNCMTGELQFADLLEGKKLSKEWKPIVIQLRPNREGAFEVHSPKSKEVFEYGDFSKEGYALFSKTLHILNQALYDPKHTRNPFWILRQFAHIDFMLSEQQEGRRNLIYEAWHDVDRERAEILLEERSPGTYLFRKDVFASLLEDQLNEDFAEPVCCITLTYRDWEEKISEKTLILKNGQWYFYQDVIDFSQPGYATVKELLDTMGKELGAPLYAD